MKKSTDLFDPIKQRQANVLHYLNHVPYMIYGTVSPV